jgi:hypothetical protein
VLYVFVYVAILGTLAKGLGYYTPGQGWVMVARVIGGAEEVKLSQTRCQSHGREDC